MKISFFSLIIAVLSLLSCKNPGSTTNLVSAFPHFQIDLEKSIDNIINVPLSSIGKEIKYIPLESNPACLIQRINQISLSDSFIFVSDGTKLIQFTNKGNFIREIGSRGRGPGEFTYIWDFCIDNKEHLIYTLNGGSKGVLVFDFRGEYIESLTLPTQQTQVIMKDTNSLMFHVPNMIIRSDDTVYSWFLTDKEGTVLSRHINHLKRINFPGFTVPLAPALYMFNNNAHFMEFGIDTLYYFNKNKKEPYAIFNLGNLKMDPDPLLTSELAEELFSQKFWIYSVIEDTRNLYININWGIPISPVSCIFNKQTAEVTFPKNGQFVNDLDYGIDFWPKKIFNDSILIDYIDAFQLLSKINNKRSIDFSSEGKKLNIQLVNLSKTLSETSNPILMIIK